MQGLLIASAKVASCVAPAITLFLISTTAAPVWGETGSNNTASYRRVLDDKRYLITRTNLVTRDGLRDPYFGFVDANIGYRLSDRWTVSAGYRHAMLELPSGLRQEYRPQLDVIYKAGWDKWRFQNRARLDFRFFEGSADNHVRLRNLSIWTAPVKLLDDQLTPYLSNEFFYEFTENNFNLNWLTLGVSYAVSKSVKITAGYRWQAQKSNDDWSSSNILVTEISFISF